MDELNAVGQLLAEPPPGPEVIEAARLRLERVAQGRAPVRTRAAGRGWRAPAPGWRTPGLARRAAGSRRWPGWLAPVAAAAAVAAVIVASLGVSGLVRNAGAGAAGSSGAFARVPRYFAALPEVARAQAVIGVTATGAVLGTVEPPKPDTVFTWATAARDDRTFVFAAAPALDKGPTRFYRLHLSRSGHPGPLVPLPIPAETQSLSGLAVSPNGSALAVSTLGSANRTGSGIEVFSLATGAGRQWVWPDGGYIGPITIGVGFGTGMSWEANNRTLLFEETTSVRHGWTQQLRLLDTTAPGGSLPAASTRLPIPADELGSNPVNPNAPFRITSMPLITGNGARLAAQTYRSLPPPKVFDFMIAELSVRTGKVVRLAYQQRTGYEGNAPGLFWVNNTGTALIVSRPPPGQNPKVGRTVFGIQSGGGFTPLPARAQRLFFRNFHGMQIFYREPVW
jgi:hypothetical protein